MYYICILLSKKAHFKRNSVECCAELYRSVSLGKYFVSNWDYRATITTEEQTSRLKSYFLPANRHPLNYRYFACIEPGLPPDCSPWALTSAVSSVVPSSPLAIPWGSCHQSAVCAQQALPPPHPQYLYLFSPTSFHNECLCCALTCFSCHFSLLSMLQQLSWFKNK